MGGLLEEDILSNYNPGNASHSTTLYASIKNLNASLNANNYVLLIAELSNDENNIYTGATGELFIFRGNPNSYLITKHYNFVCVGAYNGTKFHITETTGEAQTKCGLCTYNGKRYIAIALDYIPSGDVYFSGFYSPNCIFQFVFSGSVQWIE